MKALFTLFLCLSVAVLNAQSVFTESFDNNDRLWKQPQNAENKARISDGLYVWSHQGMQADEVTQYLNMLDITKDWTFEATIAVRKLGSEYGIVWGGTDDFNANYLLIKGKKYRYFQVRKKKITSGIDYKIGIKVRLDQNRIKIEKKGNTIKYFINGLQVGNEEINSIPGKNFGFALWNNGTIAVDEMVVSGTRLPINTAELYYPEKPVSLGSKVNSKYDEMTPVITADGSGIYFSRKFSPENSGGPGDYQDVYFSELEGEEWGAPVNLGSPVNNSGPNAVFSATPDGNTLLLMNTYEEDGRPKHQGLSMSYRTNDGWSLPEDVRVKGYYNLKQFNEYYLSNDGKVILFAIEQEDTYGNRDLYVSFREDDNFWSAPINMGKDVNTSGIELSPFLASDGVTLYFSSNGHPGYGKNDIFMSRRLDDSWTRWTEPVNLGQPINTPGYNAYYSVPASGDYAYFTSSANAIGASDIFKVLLPSKVKPKPVVIVRGRVLNSKTKEPIATRISYQDFETDKEAGIAHSEPRQGKYEIVLPLDKVYSFFAEKEGFYSIRDRLDLTDAENYEVIERDLYLTPIEVGQTAQLHNVLFARGLPQLLANSYPELNKLAKTLIDNPTIEIELAGHTDNVGNADLNLKLSEERVQAVQKYLVNKGIDDNRITGKGYGGSKPIASNDTEATRRLNRRVEFVIVKY